jgi:hypothetical protein
MQFLILLAGGAEAYHEIFRYNGRNQDQTPNGTDAKSHDALLTGTI